MEQARWMTVLALVESTQVFLHQEFLGAQIDYLQSDNAAYYHLKQLVLGTPLLNAVCMLCLLMCYI
jgi:hypothetical protein